MLHIACHYITNIQKALTASQAWLSEAKQNDLVWPEMTFHAAGCLVAK